MHISTSKKKERCRCRITVFSKRTTERIYVLHRNNNNKYINNTVVGSIKKLIVGAASSTVFIDVV